MIMDEPLEDTYFRWLCSKVLRKSTRSYLELLRILFRTEYVWSVPLDRNRAADGIELREDFARETNTERDPFLESQPCSLLEFFIAFAGRASFQTNSPVRAWFWSFMENLHLDQFRQVTDPDRVIIDEILTTFMDRTYDSHGYGGMFPMTRVDRDQSEIEIWWQFCDYVQENHLV